MTADLGHSLIKTLRRAKDPRARARFRREAVAYETLAGLGPPRLFEHNADTWRDLGTPMYMALEYVDVVNLQTLVQQNGPDDVNAALTCVRELAAG
jgi:hypothetical protein